MNLARLVLGPVVAVLLAGPVSLRSNRTRRHRGGGDRRHEGGRPRRGDQSGQRRHERDRQRRVVRGGRIQRGEPAAGHLSSRGDTARLPHLGVAGIILTAGATARVDVALSLGSMTESVNVVAENAVAADGRREGRHHRVEPAD